jgi:hypothetical protein
VGVQTRDWQPLAGELDRVLPAGGAAAGSLWVERPSIIRFACWVASGYQYHGHQPWYWRQRGGLRGGLEGLDRERSETPGGRDRGSR